MNRRAVLVLLLIASTACGDSETSKTRGVPPGPESSETTQAELTPAPITPADIKASGLLGGNASPKVPAGDPGKVAVVLVGPVPTEQRPGFSVPIIVRNNTNKAVGRVEATGAARDATGKLIASGRSQGFDPVSMKPGELALGFVYYSPGTTIPSDTKFDFTIETSEPGAGRPFDLASLKLTEANLVGKRVVGTALNGTGKALEGPFGVHVFCFDVPGNLATSLGGFATPDKLEPNGSVTFQVDLFDRPCSTFLVGVSGYYR